VLKSLKAMVASGQSDSLEVGLDRPETLKAIEFQHNDQGRVFL